MPVATFTRIAWARSAKSYPYGIEQPSATTNNTEKFTGYYRDQETGNDYAINRYVSPGFGRFFTPDPTQGSFANPADPGSWNMYAYTRGDPVNRKDSSGTDDGDCDGDICQLDGSDLGGSPFGGSPFGDTCLAFGGLFSAASLGLDACQEAIDYCSAGGEEGPFSPISQTVEDDLCNIAVSVGEIPAPAPPAPQPTDTSSGFDSTTTLPLPLPPISIPAVPAPCVLAPWLCGIVGPVLAGGIIGWNLGAPARAGGKGATDLGGSKKQSWPPCVPPVGTIGYRYDKVPPGKPHWPFTGDHLNLYKMQQNPNNGYCFWQPIGFRAGCPAPGVRSDFPAPRRDELMPAPSRVLVIGFDIRAAPNAPNGWDDDRRSRFLIREDVERPLSVDQAQHGQRSTPEETRTTPCSFGAAYTGSWQNIPGWRRRPAAQP